MLSKHETSTQIVLNCISHSRLTNFNSIPELVSLIQFDPSDPIPPANSIEYGSQGDEYKRVWSVIAETSNGKLPGKEPP